MTLPRLRSTLTVAGALTVACGALQCQAPAAGPVSPKASTPRPETPASDAAPTETSAASGTEALPPLPPADPPRPAVASIELPRGGRELFPGHRLVGWCGTPGAPALGRLTGNLSQKARQLVAHADKHAQPAGTRKILPVFELIAVVVQGGPGNDGKWRRRVPDSVVEDYLKEARAAKGLLLLNIQPGHSDFLTEAKHFDRWLRLPEVGLALDPEWAMNGKQKPGATFGQTSGAAINAVADYLARIVEEGALPEKALVYHQVNGHVVKDESVLSTHPGVVIIQSVDGLGPKGSKIKTYDFLVKTKPAAVHPGFKLFFDEDTTNGGKLMTPAEVLALSPEPEYVMYE